MNAEQRVRNVLAKLEPAETIEMLDAISDIVIKELADEREACARIADAQAARLSVQVGRSMSPVSLMAQAQAKRDVAFAIRQRNEVGKKQVAVGA